MPHFIGHGQGLDLLREGQLLGRIKALRALPRVFQQAVLDQEMSLRNQADDFKTVGFGGVGTGIEVDECGISCSPGKISGSECTRCR